MNKTTSWSLRFALAATTGVLAAGGIMAPANAFTAPSAPAAHSVTPSLAPVSLAPDPNAHCVRDPNDDSFCGTPQVEMPSVTTLTRDEAVSKLKPNFGIRIRYAGQKGGKDCQRLSYVTDQGPAAGTRLERGSTVFIKVGFGPEGRGRCVDGRFTSG